MVQRRKLLLGTVAALGGLTVGWGLMPPRQRLTPGTAPVVPAGRFALNGWVSVGQDGRVALICPRVEMGQAVHTALAMLLAEELEVPLATVQIDPAGIDPIYANIATAVDGLPFHPDNHGHAKRLLELLTAKTMREIGVIATGGSSTLKDLWLPVRQAGASARDMLKGAAADAWQVPMAECTASAGHIRHAASGRSASYGQLVGQAAVRKVPAVPPLKAPGAFKLIGTTQPRLDTAAKSSGEALFTLDLKLPGMRFATVKACPARGGHLLRVANEAQVLAMPGVLKLLPLSPSHGASGAVAVVADTRWHALQAAAALKPEWERGPAASFNSEGLYAELAKELERDEGFAYFSTGDVQAALQSAARSVKASYQAPYLAHQQMEPNVCTVRMGQGSAEVWAPTQAPDLARSAAAKALGLESNHVTVHPQLLGGGFGRRLDTDFIALAAQVARALPGEPVQVLWPREDDLRSDFLRPACVAHYAAGLDAQGQLVAWQAHSAGQAPIKSILGRVLGLPWAGPEKTTAEGAFDQPYEWPAAKVSHTMVDLPVPVGPWRSVGHSHQAFFKESFVDEVAAATQTDPLALRERWLQQPHHARHLAVLRKAALAAGWGTPLGAAEDGAKKARGLALHQSFGSIVAQVAEVSVDAQKNIRVHRVVCAIDCGLPVNPGHIAAQMESAVAFGLSAALMGEIHIEQGAIRESNFHDAPVLRMAQCPPVETHILPSGHHPEGVGEPGTPPIAPAVANALFALTGQRLRSLPLKLAP